MSSGERRIIVSLDERADPGDIVRLQEIAAQARNDALRYLNPAEVRGDFYSNPGILAPYTSLPAAPPSDVEIAHQCFSGLMVRPDNAGYLLVDPGVGAFFVPAFGGATVDDSPWILVDSPGVTSTTALLFVANGGPGVRWDIVECQPTADAVTESVLRDVFDPGTQTASPQTVDKVRRSVLTFRIRAGTQGAGIPEIDPAWMPLAAVHVRTDSAGFHLTDVYDIRPLESERCPFAMRHPKSPPAGNRKERSVLYDGEFAPIKTGSVSGMFLRGYFRGHFGGYWSGGEIRNSLPATNTADFNNQGATGSDLFGFNAEDPDRRSGAFALTANSVIAIGAFFPRGYPRWVRYCQPPEASNTSTRLRVIGRIPKGPRGILVAIDGPGGGGFIDRNGLIQAVPMPAPFGETQDAFGHVVCYAVVGADGVSIYPPRGNVAKNEYAWPILEVVEGGALDPQVNENSIAVISGPTVSGALNGATALALMATFTPGLNNVPTNASAVLCALWCSITATSMGMLVPAAAYDQANGFGQAIEAFQMPVVAVGFAFWTFWMPLKPAGAYDSSGVEDMQLAANFFGSGFTGSAATQLRILGYRF